MAGAKRFNWSASIGSMPANAFDLGILHGPGKGSGAIAWVESRALCQSHAAHCTNCTDLSDGCAAVHVHRTLLRVRVPGTCTVYVYRVHVPYFPCI